MKAVEYDHYGPVEVLQVRDVPEPRLRADGALVEVAAAALNPKDVLIRRGKFAVLTGRRFPKRVGYDWAGVVKEVGREVHDLKPGQFVFGMIDAWSAGACAERLCARRSELAPAPANWTPEEAAAVPLAALTALQALRDLAAVRAGQRVLVHGASGGVGSFAVQLARWMGAHVIATSSPANHEWVRSLGADETVDYRDGAAFSRVAEIDCWFDVFGNRSFLAVRGALTRSGIYVSTVPKRHVLLWHALTLVRAQRCRLVLVRSRARDLEQIAELGRTGALRPRIDSTFGLSEIRAAQARVETRRARGKVVVRIG